MEAIAKARYVRISPRKTRLVIDLVRGKDVNEAYAILRSTPKKAARLIEKTLRSAVANALSREEGADLDVDDLAIIKATVDGGPMMKRYRPRAMGRASRIRHRTSHVTIIVGT
ncbi:MAG: 50S ribosomal protein L22 [Candidatus Eisenbacteria sp.]|nr:50S ribosomal protein L22 [Candidatus Eisenbacteria bacterium]